MLETKFGLIDTSKLEIISDNTWEYTVYKLDEDKVLKVAKWNHTKNSGKILEELQGIPFVPELYDYDEDYLVTQRIIGDDLLSIKLNAFFGLPNEFPIKKFDNEKHKINCFLFWNSCIAKGWLPKDVRDSNMMMHENGGLWFIDYGAFERLKPAEVSKWIVSQNSPESDLPEPLQELLDWGEWLSTKFNKEENAR